MKNIKLFLTILLLILIFPINVSALNKAVYWDIDIGGRFSLKDYLNSKGLDISNIEKVIFNDTTSNKEIICSSNCLDISRDKDNSVIAFILDNNLYIKYEGTLYFNSFSERLFYEISSNLSSIEGLEYVDTSNVTYMGQMFYGLSSLTSLDLSHFDTSNVTDMSLMFSGCSSLTSLDLSNFDTSNVSEIYSIFAGCSSLINLDISNFNTSKVINMREMFDECSSLTSLDLSSFNTSNVTTMQYMFDGASSLKELDLSNFDTSNVTNMIGMFMDCSSLINLNLSNFDTSKVTNMQHMFYGLRAITKLDLSSFNTSNVANMLAMFQEAHALKKIYVSNLWSTEKIKTEQVMFYNNYALIGYNGYKFNGFYCKTTKCAVIDSVETPGYLSVKVDIKSDMYDLTNDYIYVGTEEFDISKITINGDVNIKKQNNSIDIYYYDKIIKHFDIIKITSDIYDIKKDYVYIGNKELDTSKIDIINGGLGFEDDKLKIYYDNEMIKELDLVSISSDCYNLNNDYIIGDGKVDTSLINCINCDLEVDNHNNKLIIKYVDVVLQEYNILYPLKSISINGNITKLQIGKTEKFRVTYNPTNNTDSKEVIWTSSDENIAKVDAEGNVKTISTGTVTITATSVNNSNMFATCEIEVVDYLLGDLNGNGKIDISDIILLLKRYLGTEQSTEDDVKIGDMDGNGKIGLKDVILLLRTYLGTN